MLIVVCRTLFEMSDLSPIRVLHFSGRKEEWPTWSEKFLAKAKPSGIKDVFLWKLQIPKSSEEFEDKTRRKKVVEKWIQSWQ